MRWLLFFMLMLSALPARAGSYNYRDDIFAWESAANAIRDQDWDGTCTSNPGDEDKTTLNFSNGFVFPFNGGNYASARVFINGMVQFGADAGAQRSNSNTALPMAAPVSMAGCTSSVPSGMLLVYWSDMQVQASPVLGLGAGTVSWEQKGSAPNRYVVISWTNVYKPSFLGALFATRYSFQVILYESGEFKYQYTTASSLLGTSFNADGSDATIGVQVNGGDTTQYAYRQAFNSAGSALRWIPGDQLPAPIASYSFDESSYDGSAGEVKDSSGNGNNATRVGSASSDALGQSCRSLLVPASNGSTAAGADTSINVASAVGNDGSIDFYYRSSVAWNNATAMLLDATGSSSKPFYVMLNNGVIKFVATDGSNTVQSVSSPTQSVAANTWVHIAVSWGFISGSTANVLNLWINGNLVAVSSVASTTGTINSSLGALRIGDARGPTAPSGGTLNSANGRIDELHVYNYVIGSSEVNQDLNASHACAAVLHHLQISGTSNAGAACAPSSFTVKACIDAACSSLATSGVSGTLSSSNAATLWPTGSSFSIPVGSGSANFSVQLPVPGSTTLGANATTPVAQTDTSCDFDPACQYSSSKAALLLSIPNHVAGSTGMNLSISAVSSAPNTHLCVPAFANVSRSVRLQCGYTNPPSGTVAPNVGGVSNCVTSPMVSVAFNASGIATLPFSYADVGQLAFAASYSGNAASQDQGLAMSGTTSVITAPASFSVDNFSSPLVAGKAFSANISALNANGAKTPNFMRETVPAKPSLSFTRTSPTGNGVSNGVFSGGVGGVSGGVVSVSNAMWTEVGQGTLTAAISNYLGTGLSASGVSAATSTFIPHHFDVTVTPACSSFSYSGQPFTATVTARNGLTNPTTTSNYDGSGILTPAYAQAGTYSAAQAIGAGSFAPASVPANAFRNGVATVNALSYAFAAKLTAPGSLYVRVTDANGVSSASGSETSVMLRSGRLQISSNSGSEKNALDLPLQAQYWTGAAWVLNRDDSCTVVPNQAIVLFNPLTLKGVTSTALNNSATFTLTNGVRKLTLSPASPAATGSLDVGINLGTPSNAQLCSTAAVPTSVGAQLPWLRSQNGSVGNCGAAWDRDPAARATFGVVGAETGKLIDVRIPF